MANTLNLKSGWPVVLDNTASRFYFSAAGLFVAHSLHLGFYLVVRNDAEFADASSDEEMNQDAQAPAANRPDVPGIAARRAKLVNTYHEQANQQINHKMSVK
jgi:hypothetical protein